MLKVFAWVYLFAAVALAFWLPGITLVMFFLWVANIFLEIIFKPAGPPMTDSEVTHHEEAVLYEEEKRWQEQQEEREDRSREADRLAEEEAARHEEERRKEQDDWRRLRTLCKSGRISLNFSGLMSLVYGFLTHVFSTQITGS